MAANTDTCPDTVPGQGVKRKAENDPELESAPRQKTEAEARASIIQHRFASTHTPQGFETPRVRFFLWLVGGGGGGGAAALPRVHFFRWGCRQRGESNFLANGTYSRVTSLKLHLLPLTRTVFHSFVVGSFFFFLLRRFLTAGACEGPHILPVRA